MSLNHTPAHIVMRALVSAGFGTRPSAAGTWPIFVLAMDDDPNDALRIYDTDGVGSGRTMAAGVGRIRRMPGIQIRGRSKEATTVYNKMAEIAEELGKWLNRTITIDTSTYTIHSVTQTSDITHLVIKDNRDREHYTWNGLVSITKNP